MPNRAVFAAVLLVACGGPTLGEGASSLSHPRMEAMLEAHNVTRQTATPTPDPALPDLLWSDALASDAAAWTSTCRAAHDPDLDGQGESWFASTTTGDLDAWDVVVSWASESEAYDYDANSCGDVCGHYTQIVWRDTTEVGCAFQACPDGLREWSEGHEVWVCRYSPPGNMNGDRPY